MTATVGTSRAVDAARVVGRRATPADAPAIDELFRRTGWPRPLSPVVVAVVALLDDRVIGAAVAAAPRVDEPSIGVAVAHEWRGVGVARFLATLLADELCEAGAPLALAPCH